ncbi:MAG: Pyridine nucleotide-disulfide oxidoreductase [Nitrospira sp.]|nr:FAD-dependent oxidoreductase [Nitrospira sp.]ULA57993.1 MAG: Pyridine nucleotide-disulfide oxidoreductase [Nitrospira sp.]
MKAFPMVILGGGVGAGYAAKEFVAQGGGKGQLAIVTAERVPSYERPPLSKEFLAGEKQRGDILISDAQFYQKQGITLFRDFRVQKVDFRRRLLHGPSRHTIGFEKLLIATGSSVRKLTVPGADQPWIFYLRQLQDSQHIHQHIKKGKQAVVIGSGFIGMEVASVLTRQGMATTMVFPGDRVWEHVFTPDVSAFFEKQFSAHGITFMKDQTVVGFAREHGRGQVQLASGRQISADFVVAGIGVTPALELFRHSPLEHDADGIRVNEYLETNVDHVWAAGDIANYPDRIFRRRMRIEHWDNAVEQGRVAMRNMMEKFQPFIHVPYFFSDEFDLSYEYWGDAKGHDQVVTRGDQKKKQLSVWWLKKRTLCAVLLMNRPDEERRYAPRWILRRAQLDAEALRTVKHVKSLDRTFGRE